MEDLQHEIERRLGRCMLRLQQYERLLKTMMSHMAVEGPMEQLEALRDERASAMHGRTLGTLVKEFVKRHLASAAAEGEPTGADSPAPDVPYASMHVTISMSPEQALQVEAGLAELVELRNNLVHHLGERFDLSSDTGRAAAMHHLESCDARIDVHYRRLHAWAAALARCQARAASFIESQQFEDAFVHGIHPDGTVDWPGSAIVASLREAEAACHGEGWTSLDAAIRFMAQESRDQVPSRYGCTTWPQVLRRSGEFDIRHAPGTEGSRGQVWYRSRCGAGAS